MRFWKKPKKGRFFGSSRRGISAAALDDAATEVLCREAFLTLERRLLHQPHDVERFAIWLSPTGSFEERDHRYAYILARSAATQDPEVEWDLSGFPAAAPSEIFDGEPFVAPESGSSALPTSLAFRRRNSLWVPMRYAGELTGTLIVASNKNDPRFPLEELKRIAAELCLALGSRTETALSHSRAMDLADTRNFLKDLSSTAALDQFLQELATGALRAAKSGSAPHFVMIGMGTRAFDSTPGQPSIEFPWIAGDKILARAAMADPPAEVWRNAIRNRTITGESFRERTAAGVPSRLIAVPILRDQEAFAVLVAGVPQAAASLALLERLDLYARLAGIALVILKSDRSHQAREPGTTQLQKLERLALLGQNVSGVAHELSNPLTTILGYAQRLLRHPAIEHRDDLLRIFSEADRASSILRQLLLSVRDAPAERPSVDLNRLIRDAAETQRQLMAGSEVRLELELSPNLPPVAVEAGQLQQILANLLSNARHALSQASAGGTIFVRTRTNKSALVFLEVADTGPGIPESLRARIFDPFVTTKPAGEGTGLGLSIVKSLVAQNDGTIQVQSEPGRGATFLIAFPPAGRREEPSISKQCTPTFLVQPALPLSRGGEVLVIEDEPTVAQLIADMLSDLGYSPQVMNDSRKALATALNREFELVICDMKMPDLDGRNVYRALADARSALVHRFLFVTGDVLGQNTKEFLRAHRVPHVAKPFRLEEFSEKVALVLRRARPAPAAPLAEPAKAARKIGQS